MWLDWQQRVLGASEADSAAEQAFSISQLPHAPDKPDETDLVPKDADLLADLPGMALEELGLPEELRGELSGLPRQSEGSHILASGNAEEDDSDLSNEDD